MSLVVPRAEHRPHELVSGMPGLVPSALRWAVMAGVITVLALLYPDMIVPYLVATVAVVRLVVDVRLPFSLRNYYVLYCVAFFGIGNRVVLGGAENFNLDVLAYLVAFLVGYQSFAPAKATEVGPGDHPRPTPGLYALPGRLEKALWVLGAVQVVRLAGFISAFGLQNFYSGQELVNRFQDFGTTRNTAQATVNILLTVVAAAIAALYCESCIEARRRLNYRLLGVVLLLLPALSLQRAVLVYHSLLVVAMYACDRRFRGRPSVASSRSTGRALRSRALPAALVLVAVAIVAVKVGDIRSKEYYRQTGTAASSADTLSAVLRSEFTPIVFYRDVKENIGDLGYRHGTNIVAALVTRFVPRIVWPDKPITSQELYMQRLQPDQLARGFSLAPSLFGVGYLNFGLLGCALLVGVLGFLAARYDQAYVRGNRKRVPQFVIASSWMYSLLRDDLATSLASVLLTLVVYQVLRRAFTGTLGRRPAAPAGAASQM